MRTLLERRDACPQHNDLVEVIRLARAHGQAGGGWEAPDRPRCQRLMTGGLPGAGRTEGIIDEFGRSVGSRMRASGVVYG